MPKSRWTGGRVARGRTASTSVYASATRRRGRGATRRRGLAGGTILRRGLGVPSIGPRSVLTIAAATTAASKGRQDSTNCRAPEASR
eukprot:scaffold5708_cov72-Phaeocystis_antarctica.AAC.5